MSGTKDLSIKDRRPRALQLNPLNISGKKNGETKRSVKASRVIAQTLPKPQGHHAEGYTPSSATPLARTLSWSSSTVDLIDGESAVYPEAEAHVPVLFSTENPKSPIEEEGGRDTGATGSFELQVPFKEPVARPPKVYAHPPGVFTLADMSGRQAVDGVIDYRNVADQDDVPDGSANGKRVRSVSQHSLYNKPSGSGRPSDASFHKSGSSKSYRSPGNGASYCDNCSAASDHHRNYSGSGDQGHMCINMPSHNQFKPSRQMSTMLVKGQCCCVGIVILMSIGILAGTVLLLAHLCVFGCDAPTQAPVTAAPVPRACWTCKDLESIQELTEYRETLVRNGDQCCTRNATLHHLISNVIVSQLVTDRSAKRDNTIQVFLGEDKSGRADPANTVTGWRNEDRGFKGSNIHDLHNGRYEVTQSGLYQVFLHLTFKNPKKDTQTPTYFDVKVQKRHKQLPNSDAEILLNEAEEVQCLRTGTAACHNVMLQAPLRLRKGDQLFVTTNENEALIRTNAEFGYFGIVFMTKL